MSQKSPILGAFLITHSGDFFDAGIIEKVKGQTYLKRLPLKGVGVTRAQLGLLFTIFYLYGAPKAVVQKRKDEENFLVWPEDSGRGPLSSKDFIGLARYIKRYFPNKRRKEKRNVFYGWYLNKLFTVSRSKFNELGIVQTGVLDPQDMFLLEVPPERLIEVYQLLETFNIKRLEEFRLRRKKAEELIDLLRTDVKIHNQKEREEKYFPNDEGIFPAAISQHAKKPSSLEIHDRIHDLIGQILQINDLLVPDGWKQKAEKLQNVLFPSIIAKLPLRKYKKKELQSIDVLLYESLSQIVNDFPEAELLLGLYHRYSGDNNLALARFTKYCVRHGENGVGFLLQGKAYLWLELYDKARELFQKAARLDQKVAGCLGTACTYRNYADREAARVWLEKALIRHPWNEAALTLKARWLTVYADVKEAMEVLNKVLSQNMCYWPALVARISCLYSLRCYEDVVQEAKRLLELKEGPLEWTRYLLGSALYCLADGEYNESKEACLAALDDNWDDRERGYIHLILRKIAVKEKNFREAVREAVKICRFVPERQTEWLYLAHYLDQVKHGKIARKFWDYDIDITELDQYEIRTATELYTHSNRWEKATQCACRVDSPEGIRALLKQLNDQEYRNLYFHIYALFMRRHGGYDQGSCKEPLDFFKKSVKALDENEFVCALYLAQVSEMVKSVDKNNFEEWLEQWNYVDFSKLSQFVQCAIIWKVYRNWQKGQHFPGVAKSIWKVGLKAIEEATAKSPNNSLEVIFTCNAFSALIGFGHKEDLHCEMERFTKWISNLSPQYNISLCRFGLMYLMNVLLKYEQLTAAKILVRTVTTLLQRANDKETLGSLAQTASLGYLATVAEGNPEQFVILQIESLEDFILSTQRESVIVKYLDSALVNCRMARLLWTCRQKQKNISLLRTEIKDAIGFINDHVNQLDREDSIIDYLGSAAMYCTNYFYDNLAAEILRDMDERFGASDRFARRLAFFKRTVRIIEDKRPARFGKFISIEDELEKDFQSQIENLELLNAMSAENPEKADKFFKEFLPFIFGKLE